MEPKAGGAASPETHPLRWFLIVALPVVILCALAAREERFRGLAEADSALKLEKENRTAWTARCLARGLREEWEQGLEDCDRALSSEPADPRALAARGRLRLLVGPPEQAIHDMERAASLDPALAAGLQESLDAARDPEFSPPIETRIEKARSYLKSLARIQLAYRNRFGRWATGIAELGAVVKSQQEFQSRLEAVFPDGQVRVEIQGPLLIMTGKLPGSKADWIVISGDAEGFRLHEMEWRQKRYPSESVSLGEAPKPR